ncbi:MAG TPA: DUF475 domain-containing protein [Gammaproteobacteria bacterium]|nr:DUF475 domain-containing protein [Gammaproteobacteria bacterium]
MKYFKASIFITLLGLLTAFLWGGIQALILTLILCILEISLSFDNAVLNSSVLQKMDALWRHRFLTWGILIAVFGVRFLLPIIIVGFVTDLSLLDVFFLAIQKPGEYAKLLEATKTTISSFGGIFLLLVFLSFLFDQKRNIHWLGRLERKLNACGKIETLHIILSLVVLIIIQGCLPEREKLGAIIAGCVGIILFMILHSLTALLNHSATQVKHSGAIQFLYLEVLDASFSLDGVIGAFAITKDIVIILIGLTIGAIFVRSITLFLVHKGTLNKYRFLEHGAHYAIGALAVIMLVSTKIHVSEIITGLIGVGFIGLSLLSSVFYNRKKQS